jgi:hypothetical protein
MSVLGSCPDDSDPIGDLMYWARISSAAEASVDPETCVNCLRGGLNMPGDGEKAYEGFAVFSASCF